MGAVMAQWLIIVVGAAKIESVLKHGAVTSLGQYLAQSPVLLVVGSILGLLYLPAAMVSIGGFTGPVTKTLDPRRLVRTIVRMEHEYVILGDVDRGDRGGAGGGEDDAGRDSDRG
jgi:hypothetical protein